MQSSVQEEKKHARKKTNKYDETVKIVLAKGQVAIVTCISVCFINRLFVSLINDSDFVCNNVEKIEY